MNKILGFWRKFKAFLGRRLILELAILGSFIAFTINPGSLGDIMRICGAIFLFNVLIGNYRIGDVTEGHLVVLGIFLIMLLINAFMPDEMIHRRSFRYFLTLPGMILAIHCLSKRTKPDSRTLLIYCIPHGRERRKFRRSRILWSVRQHAPFWFLRRFNSAGSILFFHPN